MPAIIQIEPTSHVAKRKRDTSWAGEDEIALKAMSNHSSFDHSSLSPVSYNSSRRLIKTLPQSRVHDTKRQRIVTPSSPQIHAQLYSFSTPTSPVDSNVPATIARPSLSARAMSSDLDLRPCHICYRQPRKRKDLEGFISCEECGKRSCFVCVRECQGFAGRRVGEDMSDATPRHVGTIDSLGVEKDNVDWMAMSFGSANAIMEDPPTSLPDGMAGDTSQPTGNDWVTQHRSIICSRCCIERGVDGEVVCMGCLKAEEEHQFIG